MSVHVGTHTRTCVFAPVPFLLEEFPQEECLLEKQRGNRLVTATSKKKPAGREAQCRWTEGVIPEEPAGLTRWGRQPPSPRIPKQARGNGNRLPLTRSSPGSACVCPGTLGPSRLSMRDSSPGAVRPQSAHPRVSSADVNSGPHAFCALHVIDNGIC